MCMARKSYSSVIEYLKNVHKRSDSFLMLLNHGDSEENVQTSKQACCRGANDNLIDDWIALMTKKKTKRKTGKVAVQNVEKTAPEVESMGKIKSSVDKSVHVDEFGLSCQDNHQIGEGPGTNPVEYLNAICNKEIPNDVTESNQQNKPMLNDLSGKFHDVEEFVESTEKSVSTDDDSMKHDIGCCYLEAPNVVKTQKQPDSTSEIADHLPILKEADNVDGLHYTLTGENFWIFLCTALGIGFNCMIVNCSNKFCKKQDVYGAVNLSSYILVVLALIVVVTDVVFKGLSVVIHT